MFSRLAILFAAIVTLMAGVVSSQSRTTANKKLDHVVRSEPMRRPDFGDKVFVDKETAARIPRGLVGAILKQPRGRLEKEFHELLTKPRMVYLGWSYQITKIEAAGRATIATVLVTPIVQDGGISTTVLGGIEEIYRLENGHLKLVSTKVKGSPTAYLTD